VGSDDSLILRHINGQTFTQVVLTSFKEGA
jgi:hypothetical protein